MKFDYKKHWGENGCVYDQTITIDKATMKEFNNYIKEEKEKVEIEFKKKHSYSEWELKIKYVDYLEEKINYTNLIHLNLFIRFCQKTERDIKRLLYRNTIIKVVE